MIKGNFITKLSNLIKPTRLSNYLLIAKWHEIKKVKIKKYIFAYFFNQVLL